MKCAICQVRKPRRECPGVHGEICTICCGTEREQSVDCPLDCPWLQEAHEHERPPDVDPALLPNRDIEVTEDFLRENEVLLAFLAVSVFEGALESPGATDWDVREAFDALIATWRTLQSGIYYETRPANTYAAAIAKHVQASIEEVRQKEAKERGVSSIRDSAILGVLVFLQRLEYTNNNGRKRSRAFLDFLGGFYVPSMEASAENIEKPDEPLIIL
ncbi:MAG: hypothetical protein ABSG41_02530 [Bryobacteraceae bacterium]